MSKNKRAVKGNVSGFIGLSMSEPVMEPAIEPGKPERRNIIAYLKRHYLAMGVIAFVLFLGLGVMAKNGWLPSTDPLSGKKTGWFGTVLPKNASSSWNPLAAPLPVPTPQLSKEYVYAGSRLLAVEDANANAAPPADLAVWRPSTGWWYVLGGQGSTPTYFQWGASCTPPTGCDVPVPGDYDGDGKTDFSVFRPSTGVWWVTKSSDGSNFAYQFGLGTDKPAAADYDGDGRTDIAVWRPSTSLWYIVQSSTGSIVYATFGTSTDIAAPADYDGDGKADLALWRNSNTTFYSINSSNGAAQTVAFTTSSTEPVSGDYDGDGKANYAVKSGASWVIMNAARTATTTTVWQSSTDKPVQNDYDGDGIVDIAVWRDSTGTWYIRQSASGNSLRQVQWGQSGDIPVPAFYRR